jgi:pSer/pThr/pTyr-binding forkhead associated (FHA) protein
LSDAAYLYWNDESGAVERGAIEARPVTLGREDLCTITVGDEGAAAVHASVVRLMDGHAVRKLTRTRGLAVNGVEVDEHMLQHGDRIAVGGHEVCYCNSATARPPQLHLTFGRVDLDTQIEVDVAGTQIVFGRDDGNVLVGDGSLSGRHLEIENYGTGMLWVTDLESTNGTELNGERLTTRRALEFGDSLQLGRVTLIVTDGGEPEEGSAAFAQRTVSFPDDGYA